MALGKAYFELGDNARALMEFQKVTELATDNPMGYGDMGSVYGARLFLNFRELSRLLRILQPIPTSAPLISF